MRLLVTGGAGCLGSNLIERYLPQGHEIFVIDNFATGKRQVLPNMAGLSFIEGSIANVELVDRVFDEFKPTHVIHSAASYKDPLNWKEDIETNVLGSISIVKASLKYGVNRLVNFQTALCYGRPHTVPIPVDHPTAPFTSYGISKTAGEAYLMQSKLPVVSLRLANICGPRLAIGPIPTFYKRLQAGKDCFCSDSIRDFLDMSDFLSIMDRVLQFDTPTGVFNVSTGEGRSILEVFNAVAEYLGIDPPKVPVVPVSEDDVASVVLDPSVTNEVLNWNAAVPFDKIIANQLEWYDAHGVSDVYSHLSSNIKS
jgi:UDP-glucose 4-epimerase